MTDEIGVWIDHRKAVVVVLKPEGAQVTTLLSHVQKHAERGGDSPLKGSYEAHQVPADDSRQRALTGDLNHFYDAVIAALQGSSAVLIFGPGEAKGELHARLAAKKSHFRVAPLETADKMTDPQVIAKVREHFGLAAERRSPPQPH